MSKEVVCNESVKPGIQERCERVAGGDDCVITIAGYTALRSGIASRLSHSFASQLFHDSLLKRDDNIFFNTPPFRKISETHFSALR